MHDLLRVINYSIEPLNILLWSEITTHAHVRTCGQRAMGGEKKQHRWRRTLSCKVRSRPHSPATDLCSQRSPRHPVFSNQRGFYHLAILSILAQFLPFSCPEKALCASVFPPRFFSNQGSRCSCKTSLVRVWSANEEGLIPKTPIPNGIEFEKKLELG